MRFQNNNKNKQKHSNSENKNIQWLLAYNKYNFYNYSKYEVALEDNILCQYREKNMSCECETLEYSILVNVLK